MPNNVQDERDLLKVMERMPQAKKVMCFGDSWFQLPGINVTDVQKELPRRFRRVIFYNEGVSGRDSAMYKRGRDRVTRILRQYGFDVLLLSMGGNDVVGNELVQFVKKKEDPQDTRGRQWGELPWQVRDHIRLPAFSAQLMAVRDDFIEMIQRRDRFQPQCHVVVHTYAYIWPDGRGFKFGKLRGKNGPWVQPHLSRVGLPDLSDQQIVTTWLIDQFAEVLRSIESQPKRIHLVDSRNALPKHRQWSDEIHPTRGGFRRIVDEYWMPILEPIL